MITWRVQELAREQGITSAAELASRAGIAINTAYSLWVGRSVRADLGTIESICKVLGCTPGDILIMHEPEKEESVINKRRLDLVAA